MFDSCKLPSLLDVAATMELLRFWGKEEQRKEMKKKKNRGTLHFLREVNVHFLILLIRTRGLFLDLSLSVSLYIVLEN